MIGPKQPRWTTRAQEANSRELVQLRDRGVCVRCGTTGGFFGLSHDHRKNRSQGGDWAPENGQLLCGTGSTGCHGWKTGHPRDAFREGWGVPSWAEPAAYPARRLEHGELVWVLYVDYDGYDQYPSGYKVITETEAHARIAGRFHGKAA